MRKPFLVTLLVIVPVMGLTTVARNPHLARVQPQNFESYVGKYPSELFKGVPGLKRRLKVLLGVNYGLLMERLQTEMPIEKIEEGVVARGCMAHSCGEEEAVIVVTRADGKLHCAILSAKFGGKFKLFSEDKSHIPVALKRAIQQR